MTRREGNKRRYQRGTQLANKIKIERGCIDCGYKGHAAALHFDHVDPTTKKAAVSKLRCGSIEAILSEIEKCVVRCANCHAIKTWPKEKLNEFL
jgi:hypothetical protein